MLVTLAFLFFCWTEIATGCMLYTATFPFSDSFPVEATIKDDEITTCWLSMYYKEHNVLQHIVPTSHTVLKRSTSTVEPETEEVEADDETWDFREWDFDYSEGYAAQANVGLRSVEYRAHGESFWFVPDVVENWEEERWEYTLRLWCPDDGCEGSGGAKMMKEEEWRCGMGMIGQRGAIEITKGIHFMFVISNVLTDVDVIFQQRVSLRMISGIHIKAHYMGRAEAWERDISSDSL